MRLEVELCSELVSPRISHDTSGLPKIRVSPIPRVVETKVGVVRCIEEIECEANSYRSSAETRKVFAESHVHVLVREGSRNCEPSSLEVGTKALAPNIDPLLTAKRHEARPLYTEGVREICDPVRDNAMLLVVRRMLFDGGCLWKCESLAYLILALEVARGVGIGQP